MPELPEVETMCRGVRPIVGGWIQRVIDPKCRYRPVVCQPAMTEIQRRLRGQQITGITRIGKRVVIETEKYALVLQPKMTGLVSIDNPPDSEHVRLVLELRDCTVPRLIFWDRRGLGTIGLIARHAIASELIEGKLGPDALAISPKEFQQQLATTRRPIKVVLLDQKRIAGIGNLYASEMLHAASIDPRRAAAELDATEFRELHRHMRRILLKAIRYEGSTLSDGTYRNALNQSGNYQNEHRVYDRADQRCPRCSQANITRIVQAQRSTFFCTHCQH